MDPNMLSDRQPERYSEHQTERYPETNNAPEANSTASVKDSMVNSTSNAVNSMKNSEIANGPMATSVKNQASATSNEFSGLANSRAPPSYTANNTELTH